MTAGFEQAACSVLIAQSARSFFLLQSAIYSLGYPSLAFKNWIPDVNYRWTHIDFEFALTVRSSLARKASIEMSPR
jgi:hypothetical protein